MKVSKNVFILGILFLSYFAILHINSNYDRALETRIAYIIDQETDDLFELEMVGSLRNYGKWGFFFTTNFYYVEPDYIKYVGKLHTLISEYKGDMEFRDRDFGAYMEKVEIEFQERKREGKRRVDEMQEGNYGWEGWDIEIFNISNKNTKVNMSETLRVILKDVKLEDKEVSTIDAVLTAFDRSWRDDGMSVHSEITSLRVLDDALLIEEKAANAISSSMGAGHVNWYYEDSIDAQQR